MIQDNMDDIDRRTLLKYGGMISVSGLFAGCTGNRSANSTNGTNSGGSGTTRAGATASQNSENTTFTYVTGQTPSSIDPAKASDNLETIIVHNVYDPLLYYTNETPPKLEHWIAKDYSIADDKKTYTLTLRDDATFHNGDPVTATDVVYSFQRLHDMNQGFSWMWSDVLSPDGVTATDDHTVQMKTETVFAPFVYTLPFLFIVNKKQVEKHAKSSGSYGSHGDYGSAWLENNDAGAGPYELTKRERKQSITIEENADWWGSFADGNTYKTVDIDMVQENATQVGMMKKGATMTDQWLPLKSYEQLSKVKGVNVHSKATFNPFYVFMHNQRAPLSDRNVRKAISYAFDYDSALNDIMSGASERLTGPLPSSMWSHTKDLTVYSKDLDKAKSFLDKSDHSSEDITLDYMYVSGLTTEKNMGLLLQSQLDEIGITLNIKKAPWSKIVSRCTKKQSTPDMLAVYLSFNYVDPDTFLYPAWHTHSSGTWQNAAWYSNDTVNDLLDRGRTTIGKQKRIPIYKKAQKRIADDAPALFVMNKAIRNAIADDLHGFNDNGVTGYRQSFSWFSKS